MTRIAGAMLVLWGCGAPLPVGEPLPCPDDRTLPDGTCLVAGAAADGCPAGFLVDGDACTAPHLECGPGTMAAVGETTCRPVMVCGDSHYAPIPSDEAVVLHVDAAFAGASDGSEAAPFATINEAYAVAPAGAVIRVAAGTYVEDVTVQDKPLRLLGRCPELVTIVGSAGPSAAVLVREGGDGSQIVGVGITGASGGLVVAGAHVLVDRVWIHDTGERGLGVEETYAPSSLVLLDSLIEEARLIGLFAGGSPMSVERSVIRNVRPKDEQVLAFGLLATPYCPGGICDASRPGLIHLERSRVHGAVGIGAYVFGGQLEMVESVVSHTLPRLDGPHGRGISAEPLCVDSDDCSEQIRPRLSLVDSEVAHNHDYGIAALGTDVSLLGTTVRDTARRELDWLFGHGIGLLAPCVSSGCDVDYPTVATIERSTVLRSHGVGVGIDSSTANIVGTVVSDTMTTEGKHGRGINAQSACDGTGFCYADHPSHVTVDTSLVELSHELGVSVFGGHVAMSRSIVRDTFPTPGKALFGDGISVVSLDAPSSLDLQDVRVLRSTRAGVSVFGAAAGLARNQISCSAFDLTMQNNDVGPADLSDLGDNLCGCPDADEGCVAINAELEPPLPR